MYRAVDRNGQTIDFLLTTRYDKKAAAIEALQEETGHEILRQFGLGSGLLRQLLANVGTGRPTLSGWPLSGFGESSHCSRKRLSCAQPLSGQPRLLGAPESLLHRFRVSLSTPMARIRLPADRVSLFYSPPPFESLTQHRAHRSGATSFTLTDLTPSRWRQRGAQAPIRLFHGIA